MISIRNATKIFSVALAALLIPMLAQTAFAETDTPPALTGSLYTRHFSVKFDPADPFLAKLMSSVAEDELVRIGRNLGYAPEPDNLIPLNVYRTHGAFLYAEGLRNSKFTVGTTQSGDGTVALDASGVFVLPQQALEHELTHAIIFRLLGQASNALPLWFNEGLAQYESDDLTDDGDELIAQAAADNSVIPLSALEQSFPKDRIDLAYAESYSAIRFLISRHGRHSPARILQALANTGSFDRAMHRSTGLTGAQFADQWEARIDRRYRFSRLAKLATGIISAAMAVLAVLAFRARRRQKEEAARRWEQEDEANMQPQDVWWADEEEK